MKILQLNVTSLDTSHNGLTFYQEQNDYDIIALQETNVKYKLNMFKNWKRKLHSTFTEKKNTKIWCSHSDSKRYQKSLCE